MKKLKNTVKIIFLLILMLNLLANHKVFAANIANEIQKEEYTEDFKKWLELSDEEKQKTIMPRMYEVKNTNIISKNPLYLARMLKASANSRYSLKDIIPANVIIKNQQQTNSCWAFATLSSLETNLALANYKKGTNLSKVYDFSERHMEYATSKTFSNGVENKSGYNRKVGSGGSYQFSTSYLTNGGGAIPESEMPFENNENTIDISQIQNKTVSSQVYDTVVFPDYRIATEENKTEIMNQIKQHIQNYGSVQASIHGNSSSLSAFNCYNNDTGAKFCNSSITHSIDHAVSIIGWDDNYSIDNFPENAKPKANGAWIVRNSWGEKAENWKLSDLKTEIFNTYKQQCIAKGWNSAEEIPNEFLKEAGYTIENDMAYVKYGDNGIIYISYEDVNVSKQMFGIVKATDTVNYDYIYQYDEFFPGMQLTINNSNMMLCNIFDKKTTKTEYLTQVSLYAPETYTCKVYVNPNGTSKSKNDLQLVTLKSGESETVNAGYHTLEFANPIELKANSFAVVIEIQSSKYSATLPLESKIDSIPAWDSVSVESGKCFLALGKDLGNCQWFDLSKLTEENASLVNGDSTIKAFTTTELLDGSLKNIEIATPPTKTNYFEGDNFDENGMVVKANYNRKENPSVILSNSDYSIKNGRNLKESQTSIEVTYEGKSVSQAITVQKNNVVELKIKTPPTKTEYKEGQPFDKTGMVVEATYKDGTTKVITDYTIENGNNLKANQTQVTISYGGKTIQQSITTIPNQLMEIKITKAPNKIKYVVGQDFDKTGMVVTGTYQDGATQEILDYAIENGTNLTKEQTSVTIKYEEKTTTQSIVVEEKPVNADLTNSKCDVKKVQAYYYTNNSQKDYVLINTEISGISRDLTNDSVEYYYHLSANADEKNIENWVKITDTQDSNNKLQFVIDSRNVPNYKEIESEDVTYIYIKEVATKGENQSTVISNSMKLETNNNVETYVDDVKKGNLQSSNSNQENSNDVTIATGKLPKAGISIKIILTIIVIVSVVGIGIFIYLKYSKFRNV